MHNKQLYCNLQRKICCVTSCKKMLPILLGLYKAKVRGLLYLSEATVRVDQSLCSSVVSQSHSQTQLLLTRELSCLSEASAQRVMSHSTALRMTGEEAG